MNLRTQNMELSLHAHVENAGSISNVCAMRVVRRVQISGRVRSKFSNFGSIFSQKFSAINSHELQNTLYVSDEFQNPLFFRKIWEGSVIPEIPLNTEMGRITSRVQADPER